MVTVMVTMVVANSGDSDGDDGNDRHNAIDWFVEASEKIERGTLPRHSDPDPQLHDKPTTK